MQIKRTFAITAKMVVVALFFIFAAIVSGKEIISAKASESLCDEYWNETLISMDIPATDGKIYRIKDFDEDYTVVIWGRPTCDMTTRIYNEARFVRDSGVSMKLVFLTSDDHADKIKIWNADDPDTVFLADPDSENNKDSLMWATIRKVKKDENIYEIMYPLLLVFDKDHKLIYCGMNFNEENIVISSTLSNFSYFLHSLAGKLPGNQMFQISYDVKYSQTDARDCLKEINELRSSAKAPLEYDYGLEEAAMKRAAELAVYFSPQRPDKTDYKTAYGFKASNSSELFFNSTDLVIYISYDENCLKDIRAEEYRYIGISFVNTQGHFISVIELSDTPSGKKKTDALDDEVPFETKISSDLAIIHSTSVEEKTITLGEKFDLSDYTEVNLYTPSLSRYNLNCPFLVNVRLEWATKSKKTVAVKGSSATAKKLGKTELTGSIAGISGTSIPAKSIHVNVVRPDPGIEFGNTEDGKGLVIYFGYSNEYTGYRIYVKAPGSKKYKRFKTVYTDAWTLKAELSGLSAGTYSFKIRSFTKTGKKTKWGKYSRAFFVNIGNDVPDYSAANAGDSIIFGAFEENPIEWIVLSKSSSELLLLSKEVLTYKAFTEDGSAETTWEKCTLRKWLNNDFYNDTFTKNEKKLISESVLDNPGIPDFGAYYKNTTKDRIFLLSIEEVLNPEYGFTEDAYSTDTLRSPSYVRLGWLLRSPSVHSWLGIEFSYSAYVNKKGRVSTYLSYFLYNPAGFSDTYGVRPALRLKLKP